MFWHLHHLWYWVDDKHPDGILKDVSDLSIAHHAQWQGEPKAFVDALVTEKFIDRADGCLLMHDWEDWRSAPAIKRSGRRTDATRLPSGRREEKRESFSSAPSLPSPTPPSIPSPVSFSKERKEENCAVAPLASQKPKREAAPHWQLLIDHIKRKWEYKKRPYGKFAPTGQDMNLLRARASVYTVFDLMGLYDDFIVTDDPFWSKQGHSITMFCKAIDALLDKTGWKARSEKYRNTILRPDTDEAAANLSSVMTLATQALAGKAADLVSRIRKEELRREGLAA